MKDKTIIITGASSGIGFVLAEQLHNAGHHVIGCSRSYPKADYKFAYKICDLQSEASMVDFVKSLKHEVKSVDVLINCAGMGIAGALEETSYHSALKLHQINVLGPFLLIQLCIPLLKQAARPKVINIASVAGKITIPFQAFYSMSKSSLIQLSEALRMELKPFNIDVCSVLPGDTKTAFTAHRFIEVPPASLYKDRVNRSIERMERDEQNGKDPRTVAKVVMKQIKRKRMKASVTVGVNYKLILLLNKILPYKFVERIVYKMYGK